MSGFSLLPRSVYNSKAAAMLEVAAEVNDPELLYDALKMALRLAPHKRFVDCSKHVFFDNYTKSTRGLVTLAEEIYNLPNYYASYAVPDTKNRAAYDWLFLTTSVDKPITIDMFKKLLTLPSAVGCTKNPERWREHRSVLIHDTFLLCDLILNNMSFR